MVRTPPVSSVAGDIGSTYSAYVTGTIKLGEHLEVIGGWRCGRSTPQAHTQVIQRAPGYTIGQLLAKAPISDQTYYDGRHPGHIITGAARAALLTLTFKL